MHRVTFVKICGYSRVCRSSNPIRGGSYCLVHQGRIQKGLHHRVVKGEPSLLITCEEFCLEPPRLVASKHLKQTKALVPCFVQRRQRVEISDNNRGDVLPLQLPTPPLNHLGFLQPHPPILRRQVCDEEANPQRLHLEQSVMKRSSRGFLDELQGRRAH
eukprot:CAMPEP_0173432810 /NCGR_PEP_ID=MMETSP1357-20121228/10484_1 /TAXON_ID=77926 /ORGANISM="Hemiselmis rufescens, Strain PCC563" /LENGTH=158 /DNA_ID=CAMNT_0014397459 /DNA_START=129 /DNA_END=605 /DNA_ORIENTATION=+